MIILVRAKKNFKNKIIKSGYSLRGLSIKAGLSPATVQQICKHSVLYPSTAKKICDAINMTFDDLFEITEKIGNEEV